MFPAIAVEGTGNNRPFTASTMKTKPIILSVFAGLGAVLSSCVGPYPAGGTVSVEPAYRPGYVVHTLPPGYRAEVIGGQRYYHHNNVYYRSQGRGYVVVDGPRRSGPGPRPDRDWDGGRDRDRDRDHRGDHNDNRGPGRGRGNVTVIRQLPNGYTVVNHRGQRYYKAGNSYYQSGSGGYVIVGSPF